MHSSGNSPQPYWPAAHTQRLASGRFPLARAAPLPVGAPGPQPTFAGPHASALRTIVRGMSRADGITIPRLGRIAVVPVSGAKPRLIFHGAMELNAALAKVGTRHA
jgi:hypothetical protein